MSSFDAQGYTVQQLLGNASNWQIVVPQFQRGYSWEKGHVSTFWDDLGQFMRTADWLRGDNYFFGPIVYIEERATKILLLDGQQRLVTATILLSVIRDTARKFGQAGQDLSRDVQRDFILRDHEDPQLALVPSEIDREYFHDLIQNHDENRTPPVARIRSHRLIRNALRFLQKVVDKDLEGKSNQESLVVLQNLKKALTRSLKITAIRVESDEQAYQIFETLNDRGLRLSPADLLLNFLLSKADDGSSRERIKANWNRMVEILGMKQPSQFLRHMWISRYGDVKSAPLYRVIRDHIVSERVTPEDLAVTCFHDAETYQKLVSLSDEYFQGDSVRAAAKGLLRYYNADKALPLFLSSAELPPHYLGEIVRLVERLYVRYVVITDGNPSVLEDVLYAAARMVREMHRENQPDRQVLRAVSTAFSQIDPSDELIEARLPELVFENDRIAKHFVRSLANEISGLPALFDDALIDLEHVFPESPDLQSWPNHEELEPLVWHLGNLTSLEKTINRRIGNRGFSVKSPAFRESSVVMTQQISDSYETWDAFTIIKRSSDLAPSVISRWPKI